MGQPKVILILGSQRGGTTIFGRLLGEMEGFLYAGEVRRLWVSDARKTCSCGAPVNRCPLWSRVLEKVTASGVPTEEIASWQARQVSNRHSWLGALRLLCEGRVRGHRNHELESYVEVIQHLYGTIAEMTGARVIVDASKHPNDAVLLRRLTELPSYVIQIVRDPRGSAHSVQLRDAARRARRDPSPGADPWKFSSSGPAYATMSWIARHASSEAVRRLLPANRSMLIRYEHLVERPLEVLEGVAAFVHERPSYLPELSEGSIALGVSHSPSSRKRLLAERIPICLDDRWVSDLKRTDDLLISAMAWPLMRRYGYSIRSLHRPGGGTAPMGRGSTVGRSDPSRSP